MSAAKTYVDLHVGDPHRSHSWMWFCRLAPTNSDTHTHRERCVLSFLPIRSLTAFSMYLSMNWFFTCDCSGAYLQYCLNGSSVGIYIHTCYNFAILHAIKMEWDFSMPQSHCTYESMLIYLRLKWYSRIV